MSPFQCWCFGQWINSSHTEASFNQPAYIFEYKYTWDFNRKYHTPQESWLISSCSACFCLSRVLLREDRNQKAWRKSLTGWELGDSRLRSTFAYLCLDDKHFRHCSFTHYFLELFLNTLFFRSMDIFDFIISNLPYCYYSEVMSVSYDICWVTTCLDIAG